MGLMKSKSLLVIAWLLGASVAASLAQRIYFQIGYAGGEAELALAKYWLHIDRSGGLLHEHISSYAEDRVGSISTSFVLVVAALICIVRAWKTRASAQQGAPHDGFAAREL